VSNKTNKMELTKLVVLVEASDGSVKQVALTESETKTIKRIIAGLHDGIIKVHSGTIGTITLQTVN